MKISALFGPEFWHRLYHLGQLGPDSAPNLAIVMLVRLALAVLILAASRAAVGILRRLLRRALMVAAARAGEEDRRLTTLNAVLASTLSYTVYFIAIILILFTFGLTWKALAPLLGLASLLGLAIGFGAQQLVRDVITGLFILGEQQFNVGDWVTIAGVTGRVEELGLRVTRIRDEQGRLCVIANGNITQVHNASRGRIRTALEFSVPRSPQLEKTLDVLTRVAAEVTAGDEEPTEECAADRCRVMITGMDAAKVTIRLTLWVPVARREAIEDALRRRVIEEAARAEVALA